MPSGSSASACSGVQPESVLEELPLREPPISGQHCLLQYSDPDGRQSVLHWKTWLEVAGNPDLRAGEHAFRSPLQQIIPAAVAGHWRRPGPQARCSKDLLAAKELVAPFQGQRRSGPLLLRHRFQECRRPRGGGGLRRVAERGS